MSLIDDVLNYTGGGVGMMMSFEPRTATKNGVPGMHYQQWGAGSLVFEHKGAHRLFNSGEHLGMEPNGMLGKVGFGVSTIFSASTILGGFAAGGWKGAFDAAVWDLATNSAVNKFGYRRSLDASGIVQVNPARRWVGKVFGTYAGLADEGLNMGHMMYTNVAASLGAAAGQAVLGAPGAFIGGYVGAGIATSPLAMGGIAAGALAMAPTLVATGGMYAAYKVGQMGVNHQANRRRIDTSGSTAAFMTQNAMTMRARAVQAIAKSQINGRSSLGMEANLLSSNRNYFSNYR